MNTLKTPREVFKEVLSDLGFGNCKPSELSNSDYWMCTIEAMNRYAADACKEQKEDFLRMHETWDTISIINKLIEASKILMHKKDYDGHGWEEINVAIECAETFVDSILNTPSL